MIIDKLDWSVGQLLRGGPKSWYSQAFEKPSKAQAFLRPSGLYNPIAEEISNSSYC